MQLDQGTLLAIIAGISGAGVCSIAVQLLKRPTEKRGVEIAHENLKLQQDLARLKEEADDREEERKRRTELRTDLERCEKRCDALQEQLDRAREERDEARGRARENDRLLSLRIYLCERVGLPCQIKTDTTEGDSKAA